MILLYRTWPNNEMEHEVCPHCETALSISCVTRVDLENFRYTTVDKVQRELERVGKTWAAQWQAMVAGIETTCSRTIHKPFAHPPRSTR